MSMSDRIRDLRVQHGMTQEELGKAIGVQKSAIAKYESGKVENIKRTSIKKMADLFGVDPSYLMGMKDVPISRSEQKMLATYIQLKNSADPKDRALASAVDRILGLYEHGDEGQNRETDND